MYVVRQVMLPLRMPMQAGADGTLYHATPRDAFTVFPTVDAATQAIGATIQQRGDGNYEVLPVEQHEAEQRRPSRRSKSA